MQVIQDLEIRSRGNNELRDESTFHKVDGAVFCKECGVQYAESDMTVCNCGNAEFLKGEIASSLAGYLKLLKNGYLRDCYNSRFKKSTARMNLKRMVIWLLIKDGLMLPGDKKTEAIVYKTMNK